MSIPGFPAPPITGYRASPAASLRPLTGELDGPLTLVPNRPRPDDWRAIVITPAPQWSATWALHGLGCCTSLFDVSSYTISAAPLESMVTTKKSARLRLPWLAMHAEPCRQTS